MEEGALEAGLFNEPTGVDFVAILAAVDGVTFGLGEIGFGGGEVDVFEEGAGRGFLAGVGELGSADC